MSYFKHMPTIFYEGDAKSQLITATDITVRAKIIDLIQNTQGSVAEYDVDDGERPEHIAHRVYGKSDYHWTILLYNEIHDPFFQWPLSSAELLKYIDEKYQGRAYFINMKKAAEDYRQDLWFETGPATINGTSVNILSWNPNLFKIVVSSNSPSTVTYGDGDKKLLQQIRSDGKTISVEVLRIVDFNKYAVHHFINQETGEVVDHHLINSDLNVRNDLGDKNVDNQIVEISYLQRYVNESADFIVLDDKIIIPVTNVDYETELNDAKRKIRVMRPEFVDILVKDITKVFLSG